MDRNQLLQVFVFRDGDYVGSEIFTESEIVIGNDQSAELVLDDPGVARNHAILSNEDGQLTLLDLGASVGTHVNGGRIQHCFVSPRDELQIGPFVLKLKLVAPKSKRPAPAPAPAPAPQTAQPTGQAPGQWTIPTDVVREDEGAQIEDLINSELNNALQEITQSITVSGSDVVESRALSNQEPARDFGRPSESLRAQSGVDIELGGSLLDGLDDFETPVPAKAEHPAPRPVSTKPQQTHAPTAMLPRASRAAIDIKKTAPIPRIERAEASPPAVSPPSSEPTPAVSAAPSSVQVALHDDLTPPSQPPGKHTAAAGLAAPVGGPTPADDLLSAAPVPASQPAEDLGAKLFSGPPPEPDLDEDELDEDERPGFSLIQKLVSDSQGSKGEAIEVIHFSKQDVRGSTLLAKKGARFTLPRDRANPSTSGLKLVQHQGPGTAEIRFPVSAEGMLLRGTERISLDTLKVPSNAVSKKGDVFKAPLQNGSNLTLSMGEQGFHIRFVAPPPVIARKEKAKFDGMIGKALGSSLLVHLLAGVAVGLASPGVSYNDIATEQWSDPTEQIREVEVQPEPPPPPEPEPEPVKEEQIEAPPPDPTPPKPKKKPRRSKRPRKGPAKGVSRKLVKSSGVLGAMGSLNLKTPGRKSMVAAVSNIDAVKAPGGSNFRVGAVVGKLPSSKVQVGGGGGGKLPLRGSASILKGGSGFARIGKRSGAKVRGTVKRATARRLVAKGSISREEVARVINKHLKQVQYCYEKVLLKDPGLSGKLVIEWTINTSGSVGRVKQKISTLRNPKVASCIIGNLKRWRFPKPRGGNVIVSYPFIFNSVGF